MAGGRRGPARQQYPRVPLPAQGGVGGSGRNGTASGLNSPPLAAASGPYQIKHARVPDVALDSGLVFEALLLAYLLLALCMHYVNLYKTVWWYPPEGPPSHTSLNFHKIDYHLVAFIGVLLSRRLVWTLVTEVSQWQARPSPAAWRYATLVLARLVLLTGSGWTLCWALINLFRSHSFINLLFLCYPFLVYIPLYGLHHEGVRGSDGGGSELTASPPPSPRKPAEGSDGEESKPRPYRALILETLREQFHSGDSIPTHACVLSPDLVRAEVHMLKTDFNKRIKEILFNSLFSAYYVAFLPLCFVKSTQYYDMRWSCEHLILVWVNTFVMLTSQLLPPRYCDLLHRAATHLGRWHRLESGAYSHTPQHAWSETTIWPQGVLVRHNKGLYKAVGSCNVAVPSDASHSRFYFLFHKPLRVLNSLLVLEGGVVVYQLYWLARSDRWNHALSAALLLFANYCLVFRLLRDRLLLGRAYGHDSPHATAHAAAHAAGSAIG
ncbi:transmembrane protein 39A-A-like isoform X2 [Lampetra fluviatilis]